MILYFLHWLFSNSVLKLSSVWVSPTSPGDLLSSHSCVLKPSLFVLQLEIILQVVFFFPMKKSLIIYAYRGN